MSLKDAPVENHVLGGEARHEAILREAYQSFRELPEITGYMPWCLMDVRVPMHWRWYNAGKAVFRYGLLSEQFTTKKVFDVVKDEIARLKETFSEQGAVSSTGELVSTR